LQRRVGLLTSYITGLFDTLDDSTILTTLAVALLLVALLGGWGLVHRSRMRRKQRTRTPSRAPGQVSAKASAKAEVAAESPTRQ
jgi:hypothetical protein